MNLSLITGVEPALVASLIAAFLAACGVLAGAFKADWANRQLDVILSFASGLLVSMAILHLIPEAFGASSLAAFYILAGYLFLYLAGRLFEAGGESAGILAPILGIGFHSFVDGLEYPVLFEHDLFTGALASAGLIIHEFAEGAIVFAILSAAGARRLGAAAGALILAAATTPAGALLSLTVLKNMTEASLGALLAFAAGALLYVGAAHLPQHLREPRRPANLFVFLMGVLLAAILTVTHHIESGHAHH